MISKAKVLGLPGNNFEKAMADFERVIDEAQEQRKNLTIS